MHMFPRMVGEILLLCFFMGLWGITLWVFCIVIALEIGKRKHFTNSWIYGLLFGPIGLLLLYLRPPKPTKRVKNSS